MFATIGNPANISATTEHTANISATMGRTTTSCVTIWHPTAISATIRHLATIDAILGCTGNTFAIIGHVATIKNTAAITGPNATAARYGRYQQDVRLQKKEKRLLMSKNCACFKQCNRQIKFV